MNFEKIPHQSKELNDKEMKSMKQMIELKENSKYRFSKLEKESLLNSIREKINQLTDKLNEPIDEGIKDAVVMLNAFGLNTSQSCEGHIEKDRISAPWVEIYPKEPEKENWQDDEELREKVEKEALEQKLKTIKLLNEFYKNRKVDYDTMLSLDKIGYGFRLQSNGLEILKHLSKEEQLEKQKLYKKEMEEFSKFLKDKFLE